MITGIGSLPFTDVDEAIDLIFTSCPEVPFWPQLPKRSPMENMYTTFLESVPSVVLDDAKTEAYMDTRKTDGIESFYEDYYYGNLEAFRVSEAVAPGFYRFCERLPEIAGKVSFIKGQLTGPFSMGLGLKDENGKPVIYNFAFFDIIKKALHMKAAWMISAMKRACPNKPVILFLDEPYLVSFGSAYVSVGKEDVTSCVNEVVEGLDAARGVHCCGNTDWSVLLKSNVDIINYDAFNFLDTIFYFEDEVVRYLGRGGKISPGLVPSSTGVSTTSTEDLAALWRSFMGYVSKLSPGTDLKECLVTPSCGLGGLVPPEARRAMELLREMDPACS
jgi:methionine synthase II (cobalamin-independent)